jgi:hypothetical protein
LSHGLGHDAHAAFSVALEKVEGRIRRYKRRLRSHSVAAGAKKAETSALFVLRAPYHEEEDDHGWDDDAEPHHSHDAPSGVIIAESETELKTLTVSMAVMEMDLTEAQTIVFRNAAHGGLSVVYRRPDGNIGWIDPQRTKAALNTSGATGKP